MSGLPATDFDVRVGERVKKARMRAGVTQAQLAAAMGVSPAQYQKNERGRNRWSAYAVQACAHALDLPISYFYDSARPKGGLSD